MRKKRLGTEPRARLRWTQAEIDMLVMLYPDHANDYIAQMLHRSEASVDMRAVKMGLHKSHEFAEAMRQQSYFKKGHATANKGKEWKYWMPKESQECAKRGQFKVGDVGRKNSPTYRPVGYECVRKNHGRPYVFIKVAQGKKMVMKHRHVWEQANGPIPKGYNIVFVDGNTLNCSLENLRMVSLSDHMRASTASLTPEQMAEKTRKSTESLRKSDRIARMHLRWGLETNNKRIKRI